VLRYKPLIALSSLVHFFTHVIFEGEKLRKKWDAIAFQISRSTAHQGSVVLIEPQSRVTGMAQETANSLGLSVVMIDTQGTFFLANPTAMLLQKFPMFFGGVVDPIADFQAIVFATSNTPTMRHEVTCLVLERIEMVIDRLIPLTFGTLLVRETIACDIQGRFDVSLFPKLLNRNTDPVKFHRGVQILDSLTYDDRIVGKGLLEAYTPHTQQFPYSENLTMIHT